MSNSIISDLTLLDNSTVFDCEVDDVEEFVYDENRLPSRQVETGMTIYNHFMSEFRWILLFAQMQSGKTETYMFAAAEMVRLEKVKNVVIFSGNRETELRDQLPDNFQAFLEKYRLYLQLDLGFSPEITSQIVKGLNKNFGKKAKDSTVRIVWGTELEKYNGPNTETLFIWDESHYGQSLKQEADKFLRKIGISADGDADILRESRNYFMSVSATPFSEMSDLKHGSQSKQVVIMRPVSAYNSVEKMWNGGRVHAYQDLKLGLVEALSSVPAESRKWAVVRSTLKNESKVVAEIERAKWNVVYYNSDQTCLVDGVVQDNMDFMDIAPSKNTCIVLKGMCRMGKQLKKNHLGFVFETSVGSKTDTVLQGLLGRSCGYGNSANVHVYLPAVICNNGEIDRYISMVSEAQQMPKKGMNIKGCRNTLDPIIPVRVEFDSESLNDLDREELIMSVKAAIGEIGAPQQVYTVDDVNNENNQAMIYERILSVVSFKIHYLDGSQDRDGTYKKEKVLEKIETSRRVRRPVMLGSGCGVKADGNEVKLWVHGRYVYVDCRINGYCSCNLRRELCQCLALNPRNIPKTTGNEVFKHKLVPEVVEPMRRQNAVSMKATAVPDDIEDVHIKALPKKSDNVKSTRISDELASFLGKTAGCEMARTEVTRDINQYIRANSLQDKTNGRKINPDSKLASLLKIKNGEKLTYFNLQRYMSPHFAKSDKPVSVDKPVVAVKVQDNVKPLPVAVKVQDTEKNPLDDCNGMFEIYINAVTVDSLPDMLTALNDLVRISKIVAQNPVLTGSKYIHHNVKVSEEVYLALLEGGAIHQVIQADYGVRLKVKIDPKKSSIGVIHLKAIYW